MGGAAGGLVADVAVAGLSFGGGAVAGALLGAAGAMGLRKGFQFVRGEEVPEVRWAAEFVDQLLRQSIMRYLAVAHFGRGRGEWRETGNPEHWKALVDGALEGREADFVGTIARLRDGGRDIDEVAPDLKEFVREALCDVLSAGYPQSVHILRITTESPGKSGGH